MKKYEEKPIYVQKPVRIEAIQFTEDLSLQELNNFLRYVDLPKTNNLDYKKPFDIDLYDGLKTVYPGDYIVEGVPGQFLANLPGSLKEYHIIKSSVFNLIYDKYVHTGSDPDVLIYKPSHKGRSLKRICAQDGRTV